MNSDYSRSNDPCDVVSVTPTGKRGWTAPTISRLGMNGTAGGGAGAQTELPSNLTVHNGCGMSGYHYNKSKNTCLGS
jgi:hypothetical protein